MIVIFSPKNGDKVGDFDSNNSELGTKNIIAFFKKLLFTKVGKNRRKIVFITFTTGL
jgi:hypothetical protein